MRHLNLLLTILPLFFSMACSEQKPDPDLEYLKEGIADLQVSDGVQQLGYSKISFRAEDTTVVFEKEVTIPENDNAARFISLLNDEFIVKTLWSQPQLFDTMVKAKANAEIILKNINSGKQLSAETFTNADLVKAGEDNSPRATLIANYLKNQCALTNAMAPVPEAPGLSVTHMEIQNAAGATVSDNLPEETYIAVDYETDNYAPTFPEDDEKRLYLLKQEIREGNTYVTGLCRLAAETGSGLRLSYTSVKGGTTSVSYSPVEIMHLRIPE